MQSQPTSYDVVAYPSYSHPQTRPDRLAVIGSLFGLDPKPVDGCRVLELACGDGGNLIPMASALPGSEFLGVDLAAQAIARGQQMIHEVGLANIRLMQADLLEFKTTNGKFDYIIAHGVYSWVPVNVRERLLALCREVLEPQGIAFVSYNAFPGSHLRNMVREMMLFHVRSFESPPEKMQQAQALLKFLTGGQAGRDEYRVWMKAELENILGHEAGHIYHDELAEVNQPFYFTEFMRQAAAHGLQYVGEADYFEMFDYGFPDPVRETLKQLGPNRLLREQYMDFLKCRRFRQTLLCHKEVSLLAKPQVEKVAEFFVSTPAKCNESVVDLRPGVEVEFETPKGGKCKTDYPLGKAMLAALAANQFLPMPFAEARQQAGTLLQNQGVTADGPAEPPEKLAAFLLELYSAGVVEFRTHLPALAGTVGARPVVSPLMRWQVRHGDMVTSQLHMAVKIEDEIGRCLLSSLDGTLTHDALVEKLWNFLKSKNALPPGDDESAQRRRVESDLKKNLEKLARMGLLVG